MSTITCNEEMKGNTKCKNIPSLARGEQWDCHRENAIATPTTLLPIPVPFPLILSNILILIPTGIPVDPWKSLTRNSIHNSTWNKPAL